MDFQLPRNVPSGHVSEVEPSTDDASTAAPAPAPAAARAETAGRSGAWRRRPTQRSDEQANVADEREAVSERVPLRAPTLAAEAAAAAAGGAERLRDENAALHARVAASHREHEALQVFHLSAAPAPFR
jgi:hypothetical protein